jgi:signal transduction histidine kinase
MSESASITGRWRITAMDSWDQEAIDLAASFAAQAAVALELSRARADQVALARMEDHDRIAAAGIAVTAADGVITVEVTDNGRGIGTPARSSGLANMRHRAERNGGTLQITTPHGGGTQLTWTARLQAD